MVCKWVFFIKNFSTLVKWIHREKKQQFLPIQKEKKKQLRVWVTCITKKSPALPNEEKEPNALSLNTSLLLYVNLSEGEMIGSMLFPLYFLQYIYVYNTFLGNLK